LTVPLLAFGAPVAIFTVASLGSKTIRAVTAAIVAVAMIANPVLEGDYQAVPEDLLIYGGAWVLGALARTRRAYTEELEAKAELLEREREERARLAVAEERGNIARELHDIVAHGVTAMVVQSEAARSVLNDDPQAADRALQSIQNVGRKNLDDLRRLLGVLRSAGDSPVAPHASLDELDALVGDARSTGLDVDLRVSGEPTPLAASTGLSAYRIIQESLTNVLKHSSARRASVDVSWGADELVITVADPGPSNARNGSGNGGHGIVGMRERAALVGGSLDVRTTPEGANVVTARLPVDGS
ncbi:MAG: sensor histidine kinase, partial [Actinomycetota bacterium]|nr:sensor histidine kinase [Actinomycetota bacterium]